MFENTDTYSVELMHDILDAVHFETGNPTLYSQVYDLKAHNVYLNFFHDFDNLVVFHLDEELAKGKRAVVLSDLFPSNLAYLDWAQPEKDRVDKIRVNYTEFEGEPEIYNSLTEKYAIPPEMGLPYPYYEISIEDGVQILKIYPDKAWFPLTPFSETSFYHASSFSHFELTFLSDENGQVNQFLYTENGAEYSFERIGTENPIQVTAIPKLIATAATATHPPLLKRQMMSPETHLIHKYHPHLQQKHRQQQTPIYLLLLQNYNHRRATRLGGSSQSLLWF